MDSFELPAPQAVQHSGSMQPTAQPQMQPVGQLPQPGAYGQPMQTVGMQMPVGQAPPPSQVSVVSGIPLTADDIDLIEKQWVLKAKEIVEKTSQDPYLQTKEINKFKAEYMKKRYNKDVKVME